MTQISDMPKIESPFVRKVINGKYIVTPEIEKGYEWVFTDDTVTAVEKLHGTNVSILIQDGIITSAWNRTERIPFFNKGKIHITEGLLKAYEKGYMEFLPDGQHFGELLGPRVNGNPYQLKNHIWIPFKTYCKEYLTYKSWGKYPKTFESISEWLKTLMPLFCLRIHANIDNREKIMKTGFVEGIVFTHHKTGKMAKLRRDMFSWFNDDSCKVNEA